MNAHDISHPLPGTCRDITVRKRSVGYDSATEKDAASRLTLGRNCPNFASATAPIVVGTAGGEVTLWSPPFDVPPGEEASAKMCSFAHDASHPGGWFKGVPIAPITRIEGAALSNGKTRTTKPFCRGLNNYQHCGATCNDDDMDSNSNNNNHDNTNSSGNNCKNKIIVMVHHAAAGTIDEQISVYGLLGADSRGTEWRRMLSHVT